MNSNDGADAVSVHGEIIAADRWIDSGLSVELVGRGHESAGRHAQVGLDGRFEVQNVDPGDYELRVLNGQQQVIQSEYIVVGENQNDFTIRLAEAPAGQRPISGMISLAELQRKTPSKAVKEFKKSEEAHADGDDRKSIAHLTKALEIYPDFAEAHNNLGIRYLKLREYPQALEQFRKAVSLAPSCGPAFTNLGAVFFEMKRLPEAEMAARQALRFDGTDDKARMILGLTLSVLGKGDEALRQLKAVAPSFPRLRLAIADMLVQQGHPRKAAGELKEYLAVAKVNNRSEVEGWIGRLEQGLPPH